MSFIDDLRQELLNKPIKEQHCKIAFLAGIMRGSGVLFEKDGEIGLDVKVPTEECALTVTMLLKSLFNYDVREVAVTENSLSKKDKFILSIFGKGAINILKTLGIVEQSGEQLEVNFHMYNQVNKMDCCLHSFIKGLFLATGNCTLPTSKKSTHTGYHLELSFSHATPAQATANKLYKLGIKPKFLNRKGNILLYLKSAEEIKDFFAFIQAPKAVLKITDLMINREISNKSNRQKNCDLGNLNRQVEAVAKQIQAIEKIEKSIGLEQLKPDLMQVAIARKENPETSLSELAEILHLSKSCLNHRLRKIVEIANT